MTAKRLFGWHAALFPTGRSGLQRLTVGAWRNEATGPMQVISGPYGRETVHFEAPGHERLEGEMARFLSWFNAPAPTDPVLRSAVAHLWFVTIHPFDVSVTRSTTTEGCVDQGKLAAWTQMRVYPC